MVRTLAVRVCLLIGLALSAQAGAISFGIWYEFSFTDPGVAALGCDPADPAGNFCIPSSGPTTTVFADAPPWTITLAAPSLFLITDAFVSRDAFEILDFGIPIGMTAASIVDVDCGDDPVACFANPGMSHATLVLGAGDHSLTIVPTATDGGGGSGYFAIVPEPNVGVFVAAGLALLTLCRQIRRPGQSQKPVS